MSGVDLLAAVAGPYTAPAAAPSLPRTMPTPSTAAAVPVAPATPLLATAPAPTAPPPAAQPATWWSVEHHNSDGEQHVYCGRCHARIPDFLIAEAKQVEPTDGELVSCEGCGTSPDLTTATVSVLDDVLAAVRDGQQYDAKGHGAALSAACLEHARQCVLLCAAARGTLEA